MYVQLAEVPGKPDAPEIVKITDGGVALKWKAPNEDGGAPIFNYIVEYRIEGGFKFIRANKEGLPATAFTVKNLEKDTIYEFRISAENRAGVGPASDPTTPTKAKEPIGELQFTVGSINHNENI